MQRFVFVCLLSFTAAYQALVGFGPGEIPMCECGVGYLQQSQHYTQDTCGQLLLLVFVRSLRKQD
jgi:hypothetical protein